MIPADNGSIIDYARDMLIRGWSDVFLCVIMNNMIFIESKKPAASMVEECEQIKGR